MWVQNWLSFSTLLACFSPRFVHRIDLCHTPCRIVPPRVFHRPLDIGTAQQLRSHRPCDRLEHFSDPYSTIQSRPRDLHSGLSLQDGALTIEWEMIYVFAYHRRSLPDRWPGFFR